MTFSEEQRQHLDFIQNVITRMNSNSFMIKGWALTILSALVAFAATDMNGLMLGVCLLPTIMFWGMDGFYLRQERLFRELYKAVIKEKSEVPPYSMNTLPYEKDVESWWDTCCSATIGFFYGTLFGINILGLIILFGVKILNISCTIGTIG